MAAKQRDMIESMHYESRQIRDALAASNARLKSARSARPPADLQPHFGAIMMQEWEGLSSAGHLDQNNTLASDNPLYQQMRTALLSFESEVAYAAPARERAFFSALRTQLMEAGAQRDADQRNMHLAATYKWFSKHKPQGPEADPVTAAVLASSLAVEAAAAPTQQDVRPSLSGNPLVPQLRLPAPPPPSNLLPPHGSPPSGPPGGAPGKHFFFDVYSRAPVGGAASTSAPSAAAPTHISSSGLRPASGVRGPSPSSRPLARAGDDVSALSLGHPLAMYPSVGGATRAVPPPASTSATAAAIAAAAAGPPRARFAATEMYAPGKLVRSQELEELDHRAAQVAAAAVAAGGGSNAMHPKPWINGPHKSPVGSSGGALSSGGCGVTAGRRGGPGGGDVRHGDTRPALSEEDEMKMLRNKWAAMEAKTTQSVADVQSKVAEWSLQRARLEEEIVRRQEAARIAPLNGHLGPSTAAAIPWQIDGIRRSDYDDAALAPGSLSPYANANSDLAAATAAAAAGPGGLGSMLPGLHGAAAAAMGASMRMRHAELATYDRDRSELLQRLDDLGLGVTGETLDRALRPLEDRPFLDCIARLPRPGENLVSRPGSVRPPAAKKKSHSKSAGKKRQTSGRK